MVEKLGSLCRARPKRYPVVLKMSNLNAVHLPRRFRVDDGKGGMHAADDEVDEQQIDLKEQK